VLDDGGTVGGVGIAARVVERSVAEVVLGDGGGVGGGGALEVVQGGDGAPREVGEGGGGSLGLEEGEDLLSCRRIGGSHDALQCSAVHEDVALEGRHGWWKGDVGEGGAEGEGDTFDLVDFCMGEVDALEALAPGASGTSSVTGRGVSGGAFVCCVRAPYSPKASLPITLSFLGSKTAVREEQRLKAHTGRAVIWVWNKSIATSFSHLARTKRARRGGGKLGKSELRAALSRLFILLFALARSYP
jgi:hypothetical protein